MTILILTLVMSVIALISFTAIQLQDTGTINKKETFLVCVFIAIIASAVLFMDGGRDRMLKDECEKHGLVSITLC